MPPSTSCNQDYAIKGYVTNYSYDPLGNLLGINQSGQTRSYTYDGLSRLTKEINPETGMILYNYDTQSPGDLYQRIAPQPNSTTAGTTLTTTYTYDPLHRLTAINYAGGFSPPISYLYDQTQSQGITFQNSLGRLSIAAAGQIGTAYSYDTMGRVADEWQLTPLSPNGNPTHLHMTYDELGDLLSLQNFSESGPGISGQGVVWTYSYNNAPSLTGVMSNWSNSSHPPTLLSGTSYNPLGQLAQYTTGDGFQTSKTFDKRGRLTANSMSIPGAGAYNWSFGYSGNGNVVSANDPFNGNWTSYTYDEFNRLSAGTCTVVGGVQPCPGSQGTLSLGFTYDQYGNRYTQTSSTGNNTDYSFNSNNQITAANGVIYDVAGNMISDGLPSGTGSTFTYDGENRVVAISAPNTTTIQYTYQYDAFGDRIEDGINDGSGFAYNDFVYDPFGHMIWKFNNQGNNQDEIYAGSLHLGVYDDSGTKNTYFQYGDQVNSMRIHSFYKANASAWTLFEANANGAGCSNNPFGDSSYCFGSLVDGMYFTDQLQNGPTNYTHFPNRDYSTTQGRWIHPDPAGIAATAVTNPQSWDRYTYVLNNPLSFIDPLGLDCIYDNGDGTVTVLTTDDGGASNGGSGADCTDPNDNGYYVDGTVDQNSTFYEGQSGDLQIGYTASNGGYGTDDIVGFSGQQSVSAQPNPDQTNVSALVQGIATNTGGFPNICSGGAFGYIGAQTPLGKGGHAAHGFIGYLRNYDSKEGSSNNALVEGSKGNASAGGALGSKGNEGLVFIPFAEAGGGLLGFSKNGLSVGGYVGTPETSPLGAGGGAYVTISTMSGCRGR